MNNKENSPFTPGSPVPVELFVGRAKQIKEVIRYIKQTSSGKQENVFLAGDRGIGKSSLASFLRSLVVQQENMLGIHVFLGRVSSLEEMVRHVFDQILKEEIGVIEPDLEKGRGSYRFVNEIYPVYLWMESERFKKE